MANVSRFKKKKKSASVYRQHQAGLPGLPARMASWPSSPLSQFTLKQTLCQRTGHVRLLLGHGDTETRSRDNGDTAVTIPCGRQEAKALNYEQTVIARGPESVTTLGSPFMPRSPATAQGAGSKHPLPPPSSSSNLALPLFPVMPASPAQSMLLWAAQIIF